MASHYEDEKGHKRSGSYGVIPPNLSELNLVLMGNSRSLKASVGNLLLAKEEFTQCNTCVKRCGTFQEKLVTVIYTQDQILTVSLQEVNKFIEEIKSLSDPGPHVFLLVLQPEDFTKEHKTRLESVLESFSEQAFDQTLVLLENPKALLDQWVSLLF
ncbi:hypothetical protein WMY93_004874 [Mugilogobius chulae]|uniref:AIG1-type G domain-containing protein n=1 Tax=Mugilogobius chulae TaxID=88201 RepID=A0AAW0PTF7_9GOBI